jgi:hypothetical protein
MIGIDASPYILFCTRTTAVFFNTNGVKIMLIANPIYDVVFKYLMEDAKVAKLLIGRIIDQEIMELEFRPQEFIMQSHHPADLQSSKLTFYRLDFSAKIRTDDGIKLVIIEIQKSKLPSDLLRFRRYLGQQYQSREFVEQRSPLGAISKIGLPIISIYFLGHRLDFIHEIPVLHVKRNYWDVINQAIIPVKEQFIECLTHDSFIISIPYLSQKRQTELELLLSIFDQNNATQDHHIMNVREEDFPGHYRPIIRRLKQATESIDIRYRMDMEDDILEEMEEIKQTLLEHKAQAREFEQELGAKNEVIAQKDQALDTKNEVIAQKDQELDTKNEVIAQKDQALDTKNEVIAQKDQELKLAQDKLTSYQQNLKIIAQNLHSAGIPEATIAQYLGRELSVIQEWLERRS